jgi:hypothetical protein
VKIDVFRSHEPIKTLAKMLHFNIHLRRSMKTHLNRINDIPGNQVYLSYVTITTNDQKVIHVIVKGEWGLGSLGNLNAKKLSDFVISTAAKEECSRFIIDFSNLHYEFGDSILRYAVEAIRNRISLSYGIVANGNTKQNILSLLDFTNMRIGLKGIYESVENALLEFNTP